MRNLSKSAVEIASSVDLIRLLQQDQSELGLHCLRGPVCPKTILRTMVTNLCLLILLKNCIEDEFCILLASLPKDNVQECVNHIKGNGN